MMDKSTTSLERQEVKVLKKLFQDVKKNIEYYDPHIKHECAMLDQQFQSELFSLSSDQNFVYWLEKRLQDLLNCSSIEIVEENKLLGEQSEFLHLPLVVEDKSVIILFPFQYNTLNERQKLLLTLFYGAMKEYSDLFYNRLDWGELDFWNEAFLHLDQPVALFNDKGETLLHNDLFHHLNLLPERVRQLEDRQYLLVEEQLYRVVKKEVFLEREKYFLMTFLYEEKTRRRDSEIIFSTKELGIVTSSMAHEMNNPIAGVLAGLSYLEMECGEKEQQDAVAEMIETTKRCKGLVEMFLGFSRYIPTDHTSQGGFLKPFEQSLSLMRFRLLENNMTFSYHFERQGSYQHPFQASIFTMVSYLLLGEILTAFHHFLLIAMKDHLRHLDLMVRESSSQFQLIVQSEETLFKTLEVSNLVKHMLQFLAMEIVIDANSISLKKMYH